MHDLADSEQPGDRSDRGRVDGPVLQRQVPVVEHVGRGRRAVGDQLPGHVVAVHQSRRDRVDGVAPPVGGEVHARDLGHPVVGIAPVEERRGVGPVGRHVARPVEVLVDHLAAEQGELVEADQHQQPRRHRDPQPGPPPADRRGAGAQEHRQAQGDQRHRPRCGAERQSRVGRGPELEHRPGGRRPGPRVGADAHDQTDEDQQGEITPVPEPRQEPAAEGQDGDRVAHREQRNALDHRDGGTDPGPEGVATVEVPVAEPTEQFGGQGGVGDDVVGLGVAQDRDAERTLDGQAGDPPEAGDQGQDADAEPCRHRVTQRRLAGDEGGVRHPQQRGDHDQEQRRGVDPSDGEGHEGEQRRVPPSAAAHRPGCQRDQPGQTGEREQDDRDPGAVIQQVRAERVGERGHGHPARSPVELPQQEPDPQTRGRDDRPQPEALRDPVGHPDGLHQPVVGTHRPEVADVLVGDGSEADVRVPHRHRP